MFWQQSLWWILWTAIICNVQSEKCIFAWIAIFSDGIFWPWHNAIYPSVSMRYKQTILQKPYFYFWNSANVEILMELYTGMVNKFNMGFKSSSLWYVMNNIGHCRGFRPQNYQMRARGADMFAEFLGEWLVICCMVWSSLQKELRYMCLMWLLCSRCGYYVYLCVLFVK